MEHQSKIPALIQDLSFGFADGENIEISAGNVAISPAASQHADRLESMISAEKIEASRRHEMLETRVNLLESLVMSLLRKIECMEVEGTQLKPHCDASSQTGQDLSYAEIVKNGKDSAAKTIQMSEQNHQQKSAKITVNGHASKKENTVTINNENIRHKKEQEQLRRSPDDVISSDTKHKYDVSAHASSSSSSSSKDPEVDLPHVWIVHDSVLNGVNCARLGSSYDFAATDIHVNNIDQIENCVEKVRSDLEISPDTIVIHCGVHDLKSSDAPSTTKKLTSTVKNLQKKFTRSSILISEAIAVKNKTLEKKRKLFNAQMEMELDNIRDVHVIEHHNMSVSRLRRNDDILPNRSGSSLLAGQLGRAIRRTVWSTAPSTSSYLRGNQQRLSAGEGAKNGNQSGRQRRQNSFKRASQQTNFFGSRYRMLYDY